jgi:hypothetical protein
MQKFSKSIKVKLLDEATSYFDDIDEKIKAKSFEKVESGHKGDWFKHLEDEIWET